MARPATDANGIVTEGKFAGLHIDEVFTFAETMATADASTRPPATPPAPAHQDPAAALAVAAAARVTPMESFTLQQFEQQDEAAFAATVPDYETYRPKIAELKKGMAPMQRAQAGAHRFMYSHLKLQDNAEAQAAVFGRPAPVEPPPPVETSNEPPAPPPPPAAPPAPPAVPPGARTPSAAPAAPPTPARPPAPPSRVPKLKATAKTLALAERWGMPIAEYLLQLEDQGVTQESMDSVSVPQTRASGSSRSVYDR